MQSFFESFAQIGLPGQENQASDSERVCVEQYGEQICFMYGELAFAVLW